MYCGRCSGKMILDRMFADNTNLEIFCIMCGNRKFLNRQTNALARWLEKQEKKLIYATT